MPEGFDAVAILSGEVGVCWLYGNDKNGELYGTEASDMAMDAMAEKGWFFERYNCPCFALLADLRPMLIFGFGSRLCR